MPYNERMKNFENIRAYMRAFYVYGLKSRSEYKQKSPRSYDNERRRIESWLGDYMRCVTTPEGKKMFLSIDSRVIQHNPLYKAWKAKSFTDGDIVLHFLLLDILFTPGVEKTLAQMIEEIDGYLSEFDGAMTFDESTVRKKLKEYVQEGIIQTEKRGRTIFYRRVSDLEIAPMADAIDFFTEVAPCGVIGSYLQDKLQQHDSLFTFKHHYITQTMDSDIVALLFEAMRQKCYIYADNFSRRANEPKTVRLVPLKIYISAQNGRQNLLAFREEANRLNSYRLDYLSNIKLAEPCRRFEELRAALEKAEAHMWGVNCRWNTKRLEHVEFDVCISEEETHIIHRLEREKRCGSVERLDECHYRYTADVFDTNEMLPWIRTFISRITRLHFSNRTAENRFKEDLQALYDLYGV